MIMNLKSNVVMYVLESSLTFRQIIVDGGNKLGQLANVINS